jgi:hypothetical protein
LCKRICLRVLGGQEVMMVGGAVLSERERRWLGEIEQGLCCEDPDLARRFESIGGRLDRGARGVPRGAAPPSSKAAWFPIAAVVLPLLLMIPAALAASTVALLVCAGLTLAGLGLQLLRHRGTADPT